MAKRRCWLPWMLLGITVFGQAACRSQPPSSPAAELESESPDENTSAEAVMSRFVSALDHQDTEAFLRQFSVSTPWKYVGTITNPPAVEQVSYQELAADLQARTGWYEALFDAGGDDCFRDHVTATGGKAWVRKSDALFVPPDLDDESVYVRWIKVQGKWVVDEIAAPSS